MWVNVVFGVCLQPPNVIDDLQSLDSCVVDVDFGLFPSLYNCSIFLCVKFFDVSSDLSSTSCLVVLVDIDEVLIKPKSKVVDADNDIISSYANDTCPKCQFLNIDEKKLQNVNKGGHRTSKHVKMWAKNAFDEWWEFWGFDTKNFIIDLAKDEQTIMELEDMVIHVHFSNCKEGW
jgi:hypothetical protein